MSAFMLAAESFQTLANALASEHSETRQSFFAYSVRDAFPRDREGAADHAVAIVRDWYKANRLAILGRYGDKGAADIPEDPAISIPQRPYHRLTKAEKAQAFKTLQCLAYQCSEDVAPEHREWHAKILAEIEGAANALGAAIIDTLPEYKAAEWG